MAKEQAQLMVAIDSFAGDDVTVKKGLQLRADHPLVARAPWAFLPVGLGEEAASARRVENARKADERDAQNRAERFRELKRQGTKPFGGDDAYVEAAKAACRADDGLELVFDEANCRILGCRPKGRRETDPTTPLWR